MRYALDLWGNRGFAKMPETLIEHLANESQKTVRIDCMDRVENFQTTATTNQRTYTLPSDFLKDYEVYTERDTTTGFQGYRAFPKPYRDLVQIQTRFDQDNPRSGRVRFYSISSDNLIYFDPIPSSAVRIDLFYFAIPADMTSDSSVPDMNETYHELVLAKLKEKVAQEIGNTAKFNEFFQTYQAMLRSYAPLAKARQSHSSQLAFQG